MALQSSGRLYFSDIQKQYGGINPIYLSEYFADNINMSNLYRPNFPYSYNTFYLSKFYGLKADLNLVNINTVTETNITFGTAVDINIIEGGTDDGYGKIDNINFPFYWFGTDFGTTNNIYWNTNQALTFGSFSVRFVPWDANTGSGLLLGQADRMVNSIVEYPPLNINQYKIKRIVVNQTTYDNDVDNMQLDIRLINTYYGIQYIEIRFINWSTFNRGLWNISNGSIFFSIFSGSPPVGTGNSIVLRSDNLGYNWVSLNNYSFPSFNNKYTLLPLVISGGNSADFTLISGNTYYYIFSLTSGTNSIRFLQNKSAKILVIGGGGGGGGGFGGSGGGGGNIYYNNSYLFDIGTYNITIGTGGNGGIGYNGEVRGTGEKSGNATIITLNGVTKISANGGGASDTAYTYSADFHAANGGSSSANINGVITNYSGGIGYFNNVNNWWVSGGGAGSDSNGVNASISGSIVTSYGNGGNGYNSSITGTATYYAGGGAGAPAAVPIEDGDEIATVDDGMNGLGQENYGGGGRGYSNYNINGETGKSGCVIISITF